ncbi:YihY/virulence factor BrkB family protein [Roseisolibacter sp. H3M3-2]|uniref:YihY/virulence factor BrkB family protein n=1 Tax=Roseisolibacter sp. H3M3-2 TaxID=3031323 RepID=UPI0023DCB7B2|nr:YihY/virulence factor BrkB family protein [Roseisolibacter sp. H3M3-2]MDF1503322.1 YihY/virulence factor BrkB family protein [Roseisolibacter sp. H3M3-2]
MSPSSTTRSDPPRPERRAARPNNRGARRPALVQAGWTLRDYARRVWDNSGEDNVFFLAGGIAFNILLAAVPFALLLITGLAYLLDQSAERSTQTVSELIDRMLPGTLTAGRDALHRVITDAISTRGRVGLLSAIGFVWFSTRLFGSLRSVLAEVFDIEQERGIVAGKLFDVKVTVVSTLLVVIYTVISAYLAIATSRGVAVLQRVGARADVMGAFEYWLGRLLAFAFIAAMFYGLYKYLPVRRVRWQSALLASMFTSALLELAKSAFGYYIREFDPGSFYTGTLAAVVIVVFWIYYAALIFILGGEVGQVYELRRTRRLQRAVLED